MSVSQNDQNLFGDQMPASFIPYSNPKDSLIPRPSMYHTEGLGMRLILGLLILQAKCYVCSHSFCLQEVLEKDRQIARSAAMFLTHSVIPRLVRDCIQLVVVPVDGEALKQAMHSRGVNMRYLGYVAELAAKRDDLQHLLVRIGLMANMVVCENGVNG